MIILKAKDSAAEIIILNSKANELKTASGISSEHVINNGTGRETLLQRGMRPEAFPAEADIKKVELRISSEDKSIATATRTNSPPQQHWGSLVQAAATAPAKTPARSLWHWFYRSSYSAAESGPVFLGHAAALRSPRCRCCSRLRSYTGAEPRCERLEPSTAGGRIRGRGAKGLSRGVQTEVGEAAALVVVGGHRPELLGWHLGGSHRLVEPRRIFIQRR